MKGTKIGVVLAFLVSLLMTFSACSEISEVTLEKATNDSPSPEMTIGSSVSLDEAIDKTTSESIFESFDINDVNIEDGERSLVTLVSFEEYENYISEHELSNKIVVYESLKTIGEFKSLVFLSNAQHNDYSMYMYSFIDSSGEVVCLTISSLDKAGNNAVMTKMLKNDEIERSYMLRNKTGASGVYTLDNISYKYVSGELLAVTWISDGLEYVFSGLSLLSGYPPNQSTFTASLLDCSTAQNALTALNLTDK